MSDKISLSLSLQFKDKQVKPDVLAKLRARARAKMAAGEVCKRTQKVYTELDCDTIPFGWNWTSAQYTLEELYQHISQGEAFCIARLKEKHRISRDFESSQLIGVDLDRGASIPALMQNDFVAQHAGLLYPTASHTPELPKTRVLFPLDRPITDEKEYRDLVLRILGKFADLGAMADVQCKDSVRLFFGSTKAGGNTVVTANVLPVEVIKSLPLPIKTRPPEWYANKALETAQLMVERSTNGHKHEQLRNAAVLLGGYCAGSILRESEAIGVLERAIKAKSDVENLNGAYQTIRDGIAYGRGEPITLDRLEAQRQEYLNANNYTPSTNGHKGKADDTSKPGQWLDTQTVLNSFGRGETGDSELLAELYTDKLAYDHAEKQWYLFNGYHWQVDERRQTGNLIANEVAAQYLQSAAETRRTAGDNEKAQETAEKLQQRAGALRFRNKINNVLALAASHPSFALSGKEWEQSPMLLAVANGVVDLATGEFRTGRPADYIRTAAPVAWAGIETPAPRWEQFLSEIFAGDSDLIAFVQRLLGYAITGKVTEHILPILWGAGRNGKETLLETVKYVLGDLAAPASKDVVLESRFVDPGRATPHLYALRPLRLAWVSESSAGAKLNTEQVKWLTGGGTITARKLHGDPVTFTPRYTLFLMTNHKPKADADDYALWKRLLLIPFTQSFVDMPLLEHEHQADPRLAEKLKAEGPGILAWLVRGCLTWQAEGLRPPAAVTGATEAYRQDEVLPPEITQFIEDCCIVESDKQATGGDLFKRYDRYAKSLNLTPVSTVTLGKMLKKRFRVIGSNPVIVYGGIGLLADEEQK